MQSQNHIFSERTDALAHKNGCTLRELGDIIGISTAMVFAYRSGKNEISKKAWLKLEAAENKAGIAQASVKPPGALLSSSLLSELSEAIDKAQAAESLILDLKQTLEKLLKKL